MEELDKLRKQLDMCDEIIVDTLRMRYQIVQDITNFKKANNIDIVQIGEEERKKNFVASKLEDYRYKKTILRVFDKILYGSKRIQSHELFDINVYLIGFMGAGKSTISNTLKEVFAMEVVEMDEIISERNGMSISEIFELHGEQYFRNEETNLLKEIGDKKNVIVSCGGGVALREENVKEMKKSGKIILLTASAETILERVKESHDRPLLENNKNVEFISSMLEKRKPFYEAAADVIIDTNNKSSFEICDEIIRKAKV